VAKKEVLLPDSVTCASTTQAKMPKIPPTACAEFIKPIPRPSEPLPKYSEISTTLGPKKHAIPTPTINLRMAICTILSERPVRNTQDDASKIPKTATLLALYFAARIPAGTWKSPTPRIKLDVTNPSVDISCLKSIAIR
jgi:hypothetical protein